VGQGILLSNYCNSCTVKENRFNSLNGNGIEAGTLVKGVIQDNKIVSTSNAIKIGDGTRCIVTNNYIEESQKNAIEIKNDVSWIENNEIISSNSSAIESSGSNGAFIRNNAIKNAGLYGIHLEGDSGSSIEGNRVDATSGGIFVEDSENIDVSGNNIGASSFGLKESSSKDLRISGNIFCGNEKDAICESKFFFNDNRCNSKDVCGGSCITCGKKESNELSSLGLWQRIKLLWELLF
jgi:parallel beta-helix repeat protein